MQSIERGIQQYISQDLINSFRFIDSDFDPSTLYRDKLVTTIQPYSDFYKELSSFNDQSLDLIKLKTYLQKLYDQYDEMFTKLIADTKTEIAMNQLSIEKNNTNLKTLKTTKIKIIDRINDQGHQINELAIKLGLPLFCITILLLFLAPKYINSNRNLTTNEQNGNAPHYEERQDQALIEISTVLLLTMSILILGLSRILNAEVLGTLIGGISGYVLNRTKPLQNLLQQKTSPNENDKGEQQSK